MKSYDIVEWGRPLQAVVRETPRPEGTQVLVRVSACGVCHSDLHIQGGALDLGEGRRVSFESVGVTLPFTMGHEIVGEVAAAGPQADVAVGTRCVVYPWHGCGQCRLCLQGDELSCAQGMALGTRRPGGYADFVMVPHPRYLLDPGTLDPLLAATCACSGLTAYAALRKLPPLTADDTLLLIGAGGLGLAALGLAAELTPARVVVADIAEAKLAAAARAGAQGGVNLEAADDEAALARLRELKAEVRAVIDFVGSPRTVGLAMKAVGRGGSIVVVGLFGGALPVSTALLPMRNLTLRGSYVGTLAEMEDLLALLQRRPLLKVPLEQRPMSALNQALADLAAGRVAGRLLVTADG
jgi:alcohol dehydrogenase, propanol-preferring